VTRLRILFTFSGGTGHLNPLVPIARAAQAAGHVVAVTGQPSMVATIEATGLPAIPTGTGFGDPTTRIALKELDADREDQDLRDGFANRMARDRAVPLLELCAGWRPHVLVCDETDFGGMVAAERLGLPYATVVVLAAGSLVRPALLAETLDQVRAEHGLPADPQLAMLSRYLVLSPFPPSFRDPAFPLPATAHSIRPQARRRDQAPGWMSRLTGAPVVYFTLGTVFNLESGDLFERVLAGLRTLPVNLVATVGRQIDPAELGPQPPNVHIEQYVPQEALLPYCDAVVSHGGSGSVIGALTHGVPMVLAPMGADQPHNAARCEQLGVARVLDALRATPEDARAAVSTVLADRGYRRAAERLRDEIAALPGPARAVGLLERLAAEKRPIR